MNWRKITLLVLLATLVLIQFIRPERNEAPLERGEAFMEELRVSIETREILAKACLDCHSDHTVYPWYFNVQPVGWWLDHHIEEGREELNFSTWDHYSLRRKYHKLEEIVEMVEEGEMPLNSYTWTHSNARLSEAEKENLVQWAKAAMHRMEAQYPMDSLVRKK